MKKKSKSTRIQKIIIRRLSNKLGTPNEKEFIKSGQHSKKYKDYFNQIDQLSLRSRNLYNHANYIVRQEFFKTSKEKEQGLVEHANWIRYNDLDKICQKSIPFEEAELNDYKTISCSGIAQHTLKILDRNWKSYFASIKDYGKHPEKYKGKPKPPKYMKDNRRIVVELTSNQIKNKDGYAYFSLKSLKNLNNTFKLTNETGRIISARFVPIGGKNSKIESYAFEIIQEVEIPAVQYDDNPRIAGIDLGINNLATVVTNCGIDPIAINGKPLKSINAYYNKKKATMVSDLKIKNDKDWSRRLNNFTQKRNRKVDDYIHKASTKIVNWCVKNEIDVVVCGHNTGWKQDSNMGKVNNQNFISIPHSKLIQKIQYKCENFGIGFIETEEAYTSGTSFLDNEEPTEEYYNKSRRKKRGLFISNTGDSINADVNGAYQIIKKEFPNAFSDNIDYKKHPEIINI